jgi:ribosomal-protein-alanine N-acetyltransferase
MKEIVIRRMGLPDLDNVREIDADSLIRPWSQAVWKAEIKSPYGLYLVLEDEGVAGYVGVKHISGELHVMTLAIRADRRRQGYARTLLGEAFAAYPDAKSAYLEVRPSNMPARNLYESLGFVVTGRRMRYYGDEDALLMTLDLRDPA